MFIAASSLETSLTNCSKKIGTAQGRLKLRVFADSRLVVKAFALDAHDVHHRIHTRLACVIQSQLIYARVASISDQRLPDERRTQASATKNR